MSKTFTEVSYEHETWASANLNQLPSGQRLQFAIENAHLWLMYLAKLWFSYVSLPEGICLGECRPVLHSFAVTCLNLHFAENLRNNTSVGVRTLRILVHSVNVNLEISIHRQTYKALNGFQYSKTLSGGFHKLGYPQIIHIFMIFIGFSLINHPAIGVPLFISNHHLELAGTHKENEQDEAQKEMLKY